MTEPMVDVIELDAPTEDGGTSPSPEDVLKALGAEFPAGQYKQRQAPGGGPKLTYVSIDATINRFNEVLGPQWRTEASTKVTPTEGGKYLAVTELVLTANIGGVIKAAYGVGAMENKDADMAAKSALAEAIKKAGHQYGIALDLWDADKREAIEAKMALANASDAKLKAAVYELARNKLSKTKPTIAEVAELFGYDPSDMTEPEVNREILSKEGLL